MKTNSLFVTVVFSMLCLASTVHAFSLPEPASGHYEYSQVRYAYDPSISNINGTMALDVYTDGTFKATSSFGCLFSGNFSASVPTGWIGANPLLGNAFVYVDYAATISNCNGSTVDGTVVVQISNTAATSSLPSIQIFSSRNALIDIASSTVTRTGSAASSTAPVFQLAVTGLWWNANESGWGMSLTQHGSTIFVVWFPFDVNGNPVWYVASNCAVSGNACVGDLYQVKGGSAPTSTWNGSNKSVTKVGTVSLSFTDNSTGSMAYTINGTSGSKSIAMQPF